MFELVKKKRDLLLDQLVQQHLVDHHDHYSLVHLFLHDHLSNRGDLTKNKQNNQLNFLLIKMNLAWCSFFTRNALNWRDTSWFTLFKKKLCMFSMKFFVCLPFLPLHLVHHRYHFGPNWIDIIRISLKQQVNLLVHLLDQHYQDNLVDQHHHDHLFPHLYHVDQVFLDEKKIQVHLSFN